MMEGITPRLLEQYKDYASARDCYLWVINRHIKSEKGTELEFKNHKFLKDIYNDFTPIQVVRKASQIGFSVMKILKAFWLARYRNYNIIYTLPTFRMAQEFGSAKVNALISQNPILERWVQNKDSIFQKKIGNGFIHFRGTSADKSEEEKAEAGVGIMLSSDVNIYDECDKSDQDILEQYHSRMAASDYKGEWYFSNPTTPRLKSQKLYEQSDQKHWFVKCEHCNHFQYLDYWKNIKGGKFVCEKCGEEISNETRKNGQWVRKYKNKDISGYWLPHLICPWITAKEIEDAYLNRSKQYFYNFVLGLPYIGSEITVNRDIILRNIDITEPNFQEHNVLGVDQGLQKHWVLGNQQGIFAMGQTDDWQNIEELIRVYDVETAVFDALPDLTEPRKLRDKYPGKIWLSYYKKEVRKADFIFWDYKTHTVYSDRSKIIQQVIDEMVNKKIRFQMKPDELGEYIRHWQTLFKTTEKDNLGIERDSWATQGEDHYVHATVYFRIALEKTTEKTEVKEWQPAQNITTNIAPEISKMVENQ